MSFGETNSTNLANQSRGDDFVNIVNGLHMQQKASEVDNQTDLSGTMMIYLFTFNTPFPR